MTATAGPNNDSLADADQLGDASRAADAMGSNAVGAVAECPQKAFVAIRLIDDDGNLLIEEEYKLTLPGGGTSQGKLDESAEIWAYQIDPGQCSVEFPNLDKHEWPASPAIG